MSNQSGAVADCLFCTMNANAKPESLVYRDDCWTAEAMMGVPGWIMVRSTEHVDGMWNMPEENAATLGKVFRAIARGLRDVADAKLVYTLGFGDSGEHADWLLQARTPNIPADIRGVQLFGRAAEFQDAEGSARVAADLQAALKGVDLND